jgi:hypothetical protein
MGTLLALVEQCAAEPLRSQIRPMYEKTLRKATEEFLRTQADDAPNLVSALREILKHQLDRKDTP